LIVIKRGWSHRAPRRGANAKEHRMLAKWDDKYRTGDPMVDLQHRELFTLVNELHDAIIGGHAQEAQGRVLARLGKYVVEHFATEERLMLRAGYPGYAQHKAVHDQLTAKATQIIKDQASGKLVLALTVSTFLADWVKQHIGMEDMRMVTWLRQHQAA
jgi:hemerythrin